MTRLSSRSSSVYSARSRSHRPSRRCHRTPRSQQRTSAALLGTPSVADVPPEPQAPPDAAQPAAAVRVAAAPTPGTARSSAQSASDDGRGASAVVPAGAIPGQTLQVAVPKNAPRAAPA